MKNNVLASKITKHQAVLIAYVCLTRVLFTYLRLTTQILGIAKYFLLLFVCNEGDSISSHSVLLMMYQGGIGLFNGDKRSVGCFFTRNTAKITSLITVKLSFSKFPSPLHL